jgi:hypothetical protein
MTIADVARWLHLPKYSVIYLALRHGLPCHWQHARMRFERDEIKGWIQSRKGNDDKLPSRFWLWLDERGW